MSKLKVVSVFMVSVLATGCLPTPQEVPGREGVLLPDGVRFELLEFESQIIADGMHTPWSIEILAEDEYLVSDRMGDLIHIRDDQVSRLHGVPASRTIKADRHYGGLMDLSLHPRFEENHLVYLAYVDTDYKLVVGRFAFPDRTVRDFEVIFRTNDFSLGSRIEWQDDVHFFVSQGKAGVPLPEPGPQDLDSDGGKIHRLMEDGSIPSDNPVFEGKDGPTSIWSYGHRDPQGLYFDHQTNVLYSTEHGPLGGDELNIVQKAGNYGWPRFSYGLNYDGSIVGDLSEEEADSLTTLPFKAWCLTFNMAPSGLSKVVLPGLGSRFVWGSLVQQRLISYDIASSQTSILMDGMGRIREVKQLPDGKLLLLVDSEGSFKAFAGSVVKVTLNGFDGIPHSEQSGAGVEDTRP